MVILTNNNELTLNDITKCDIVLSSTKVKTEKHIDHIDNENNLINLNPGTLNELEQQIIQWYMNYYNNNRIKVCDALNIGRTTLWKKLKENEST